MKIINEKYSPYVVIVIDMITVGSAIAFTMSYGTKAGFMFTMILFMAVSYLLSKID